jgi:uncharacterized protein (TIGR03435 family)
MMQFKYRLFVVVFFAVSSAEAQRPAASANLQQSQGVPAEADLAFTVASVKPARLPPEGAGRQGAFQPQIEPGRLRFPAVTLKTLLMFAYDVKDFQIVGPGWMGDQRFVVEATMPTDTTQDQTRIMLRNLIAQRFRAEIHRESKLLPIYSLAIAKRGLKIPNTPTPRPKQVGDSNFAKDGFPVVPPEFTGIMTFLINGQAKMTAQQATMHDLAAELERRIGIPVRDETQLTGKFDFILQFSPEGLKGPGGQVIPTATTLDAQEPQRDIFSALQSDIGLKLEFTKGPVETIVLDHAEKVPTDN